MSQTTLADRGTRLGAILLDLLAAIAAMTPGLLVIAGSGYNDDLLGLAGLLFFVGWFGVAGYQIYLLVQRGQTIGKRALGIRIVDHQTDDVPNWLRVVFVRQMLPGLIGAIPYVGWAFLVADPLFIFRDDRRCLHDFLAETEVIVGHPDSSTNQASTTQTAETATPPDRQPESPSSEWAPPPSAATVDAATQGRSPRGDNAPSEEDDALMQRLEKLHRLHQNDVLTDQEYQHAKRKALAERVGTTEEAAEDVLITMHDLRTKGLLDTADIQVVKDAVL
jgi:uncharacterized RDD family membrane protein YckC